MIECPEQVDVDIHHKTVNRLQFYASLEIGSKIISEVFKYMPGGRDGIAKNTPITAYTDVDQAKAHCDKFQDQIISLKYEDIRIRIEGLPIISFINSYTGIRISTIKIESHESPIRRMAYDNGYAKFHLKNDLYAWLISCEDYHHSLESQLVGELFIECVRHNVFISTNHVEIDVRGE